jgi:hypothetical protein
MIVGKDLEGGADFLEVADAFDAEGALFSTQQRGQQERGENGDDGNDDKHFDQGERLVFSIAPRRFHVPSNS